MQKTKIKLIIILVSVVIVAIAAVFVSFKLGLFDAKNDELSIDKTANVITEIKKISEFTSACFYEEIILKESKATDNVTNKVAGFFGKKEAVCSDEIVIIANGKVRAGFNLQNLKDEDIIVNGDTLTINLPKAEIFDVIVNPSDFDIYIEDGKWSQDQVTQIENKAITQIKQDAINDGIMAKAEESGVKKLTEIFKTFGFSEVSINVAK